ncbi:Aste57867_21686 [Aphanomyces stellatus]|uniref:Aste57867_21686 protein n=1 Tax=Aphanomyces stellatus TaxID=120398 RepID=A0A485LIU5_9STRA|nr:hypothetical protein As57867_021617 [Aphanomyces stellatus]VFT98355.1 Aste57867_21686 [Aphanomyces stellatus]
MLDALAQVARWYRKRGGASVASGGDEPCCPATKLHRILADDAVQEFLRSKVSDLRDALRADEGDPSTHANLALFYELIDAADGRAMYHMQQAMTLDPSEVQYKAHHRRMAFNTRCKELRKALTDRIHHGESIARREEMTPVDVVDASDLSVAAFQSRYATAGLPVVIRHGASLVTKELWSLESLQRNPALASLTVETKRTVVDSVRWARLEDGPRVPLAHLPKAGLYVHDVSLPLHLPQLMAQDGGVHIPAYFARDYLQHAPPGALYRETWPSLFVGPAGTASQTHIDSFGSNFWMALMEGRKRWRLIHPDDVHLLYPTWHVGTPDIVFAVDMTQDDASSRHQHALFQYARVYECILEAGDILFVPAGAPHYVENLTDTTALSCNYIDASNWARAQAALECQAWTDPRAAELLAALVPIHAALQDEVPLEHSIPFDRYKHPTVVRSHPAPEARETKLARMTPSLYDDLLTDLDDEDMSS